MSLNCWQESGRHILMVAALSLLAFQSPAQNYQLTDLGASLGPSSYAQGINNRGQVVGYWSGSGGAHAFLYDAGALRDLGTLGGSNSYALSINDSGQIVGFAETGNGLRAFLCQDGTMTNLDVLGGFNSYAWGINGLGQIVGHIDFASGSRAFLYGDGAVTDLGTLGGTNSFAFGINGAMQVAGASLIADNVTLHAFRWEGGVMTNLNRFLPPGSGWQLQEARGINDSGDIVGSGLFQGWEQAFLYHNGAITGLGALSGATNSYAFGLNNAQQIVGTSSTTSGNRACLWQDGAAIDLNERLGSGSGWVLREARGINDLGQIVGWGVISGEEHAFLLTPTTKQSSSGSLLTSEAMNNSAPRSQQESQELTITQQPQNQQALLGGSATFTVVATGQGTLAYQWHLNGTNIPGATASSCTRTNVQLTDFGSYSVTVTNIQGSVTSPSALLSQVLLSFVRGINLNGLPVTVESNSWSGYTNAPSNGLSISNAIPGTVTNVTILWPTDTGTSNMLQTFIQHYRLPPLAQQRSSRPAFSYAFTGRDNPPISWDLESVSGIVYNPTNGAYIVTNGTGIYRGWCLYDDDLDVANTYYPSMFYYSCGVLSTNFTATKMNRLNYILNNRHEGTLCDIQNAIWSVVGHLNSGECPYPGWLCNPLNNTFISLTNDAVLYGGTFVPTNGQLVAVLADPERRDLNLGPAILETTNQPTSFTLTQSGLTNGTYYVCLWLAETEAAHSRSLEIQIQNTTVAIGVGDLALGQWSKLGPYAASVSVSNLTIRVSSPTRGDPVLMGLALYAAVPAVQPPTVNVNPANLAVCPGLSATFYATNATGTSPLSYRWSRNGVALDGQTGNTLVLASVSSSDAGLYSVTVTNSAGNSTSSATLTVWTNTTVTGWSADTNVCPGDVVCFGVSATGTGLSYQWSKNGTPLVNKTNSTLILSNISNSDAGTYSVVVGSLCGPALSNNAVLFVKPPLTVTNLPVSLTNCPGSTATFAVGASGSGLGYQWFKNRTQLAGQTGSSLLLTNLSVTNAGTYCVSITGPCGATNVCAMLEVDCLPVAVGLINWWQGEGNAYDAVAGHNGILIGGSAFSSGKVAQAFAFNGSDAEVDLGNWFDLQAFSVAMWVKPGATQVPWANIIDNNHAESRGWVIEYQNSGLQFIWGAFGLNGPCRIPVSLIPDTWQHLVVNLDAGGVARVYLNGQLQGSGTLAGPVGYDGSQFLRLGNWGGGWRYFNGLLDEVQIYSRALSAAEVQALYNAGSAGSCGLPPSFILEPANQAVTLGNEAVLRSLAAGTSLGYQWCFNSNAIPGANLPSLTIPSASTNDAGSYSVLVTNSLGQILSSNAVLSVVQPNCFGQPAGLVGWWRGEYDGSDFLQTNNATTNGNLTFMTGKVEQAFAFDGTNAFLQVPASPSLDVGQGAGFTLECWIQPADTASLYPLVDWRDGYGNWGANLWINYTGNGAITAEFSDPNWIYYSISSPAGLLNTNRFQHVALSYDQGSGTAALYYNGYPVVTQSLGSFATATSGYDLFLGVWPYDFWSGSAPWTSMSTFGGLSETNSPGLMDSAMSRNQCSLLAAMDDYYYGGYYYAGLMDEVSLYNRALSPIEIQAIYNAGFAGKCLPATNSAPWVQITSPVNQTFTARTSTVITATTSLSDSTNAWVQFFAWGTNSLGYATAATNGVYQIAWKPVVGGVYILTAFVTNTSGSNAWSAPVTNFVRSLPTVTITSPIDGAVFGPAPTNILITATASADDATITNVVFYQGTNLLGSVSLPPYNFARHGVAAGAYTLTARATDSTGASALSHPVGISVVPANQPPVVHAGPDLTARLPHPALLAGTVSDDGLPLGTQVTVTWTNVGGPSGQSVTFSNANQAVTFAFFSGLGSYTNRLEASDGESTIRDEMVVQILETNLPPVVNPGPNQILYDTFRLQLAGSVQDDGQPASGSLSANWRLISGPGMVTFVAPWLTNTSAYFSQCGTYVIELSASDGELSASSNVVVTVTTNAVSHKAAGYDYFILTNRNPSCYDFFFDHFYSNCKYYGVCDNLSVFTNEFQALYGNFYALDFHASGFATGSAPFGNLYGCWPGGPADTNYARVTTWAELDGLLLRKGFIVPPGTTNLSLAFTVDDGLVFFLNGQFAGWNYRNQCPELDREVFNSISPSLWHEGTNLLAVWAIDMGEQTYLDVKVGVNQAFPDPPVDNPPVVEIASPDQFIELTNSAILAASIADPDDGPFGQGLADWEGVQKSDSETGEIYFDFNGVTFTNAIHNIGFTNFLDCSVTVRFSEPGEYLLELSAHRGNYGYVSNHVTVTVIAPSGSRPAVSLLAPTNGTAFAADVPIQIAATAASPAGTITNVQFLERVINF